MEFQPTWYATPNRARSVTKWIVYDDVGTIDVRNGQVSFQGKKLRLEWGTVTDVILTRQRVNWVSHLIVAVASLPMYLLIAFALNRMFSVPMSNVLMVCYLFVALAPLIGSTKWIRVSFGAQKGVPSEAWFADGGFLGWRGNTGRLFDEIRQNIRNSGA
jgi:hypothetical protein